MRSIKATKKASSDKTTIIGRSSIAVSIMFQSADKSPSNMHTSRHLQSLKGARKACVIPLKICIEFSDNDFVKQIVGALAVPIIYPRSSQGVRRMSVVAILLLQSYVQCLPTRLSGNIWRKIVRCCDHIRRTYSGYVAKREIDTVQKSGKRMARITKSVE